MKHSAKSKALVLARIKDNAKIKPHTWGTRKRGPWDTKKADGGEVADKPAFDLSKPFQAADAKPPFDPSKPFETTKDAGKLDAALQGAKAGLTFNFSDELAGIHAAKPKAVPEMVGPIPAGMIAGAGRLGLNAITGADPEAATAYEKARDEERAAQAAAKEHHPYIHGAGEIAGSIPSMAALPEAGILKGAGIGKRMLQGAQVGAEYGALSGAGEGKDTAERATGAATGAGSGIVGGAIAPALGSIAGAAYDKFGKPIVGAIRGAIDPAAEASRRLGTALKADQDLILAGKAEGMAWPDWIKAKQAGEPVTLADLGSSNTQALLRSSANTSPEGRAILEKALQDRFEAQGERVADEVRGLVAGGANANKTADQLVAEYDLARVPAYKRAYAEGDKEIMTPTMERLMSSPMVVDAMKRASVSGKDRAVTQGFGAFNPGVVVENGLVTFKPKSNGVPTYPNLQYWDAVKRELDDVATSAARKGEKGQAEVAGNLAKSLRSELDKEVPSYSKARGVAEDFFGERNALEAGRTLAGKRADPEVVAATMRKMGPEERELFKEGYASDLANRVIGNIRDSRDITKAIFATPNERKMAATIFGAGGMKTLENRMSLETIMDASRKAMGNSTTARQLIEAGLAGGALEGYLSGWDPTHMGAGFAGGVGARKFLGSEMAAGARKFVGKVDVKTARTVAELLTSDDPKKLRAGIQMAAKNQKIADGLRSIANRVALAGQNKAIPRVSIDTTGWGRLQGPTPAAGDEQQQAPRVGN